MNTPIIETQRLILRKFTESDLKALYEIFSDEEANIFLPWFPLKSMGEAKVFLKERFLSKYKQKYAYNYAVCLAKDNFPIGYVNVSTGDGFDFGYGLRREFWRQGIITEAGKAVIEQLKKDGVPYITATHDINNPRSGRVMQKLGMKYRYSYGEQWQPKNRFVIFRMYQLNFDGQRRVYKEYWDNSTVRFVERDIWFSAYQRTEDTLKRQHCLPFPFKRCALHLEKAHGFPTLSGEG